MKRISQLFLVSIVSVFVVFFALGQSPVMAQNNAGNFTLELEVDWPTLPSFDRSLNEIARGQLSPASIIFFIYNLLLWLSIILAFLALIYAGFLYIVSGANPGARSKAFDYVKRIAFGGTILLLTVLILSFINTDLIEVRGGVTESVYCGGLPQEQKEDCERDIGDISNFRSESYDVSTGAFEYAIRTTPTQVMEVRLRDLAISNIKEEIGFEENAPIICPQDCKAGGAGEACMRVRESCKKYDFNNDDKIDARDFTNNIRLIDILTASCVATHGLPPVLDESLSGEAYLKAIGQYEQDLADYNYLMGPCRWDELHSLINEDFTKTYKDNAEDASSFESSPLYVFKHDDDAAPSCAARCIYYQDSNSCKSKVPENELLCNNWGRKNDVYQRDGSDLELSEVKSPVASICKVEKGVTDDDFKTDWVGNQRAKCAANYVVDSFTVPLFRPNKVVGGHRISHQPPENISKILIKNDKSNQDKKYNEFINNSNTLYGCYCRDGSQ